MLHTALQAGRSRVRFPMGFIDGHFFNSADRTMVLGSASNINDCQGNIFGVKRPVRKDDNLATFTCWLSRNSGSLTLMEPEGPDQARKRTALPNFTSCVIRVLDTTDQTVLCQENLQMMECAVHLGVVLVVCHAAAVNAACVASVFNWAFVDQSPLQRLHKAYVFFFIAFGFSLNKLTPAASTKTWHAQLSFSSSWFAWNLLMVFAKSIEKRLR